MITKMVWEVGERGAHFRQVEFEQDQIDLEVAGLHRIQVARTRELLAGLGFDVDGYDALPLPRPIRQRSTTHPDEWQLADAIVQRRVAYRASRTITRALRPVQRRR